MASGKGQNLLVWVIVFVVLTVVSGVTAFLFYQQSTKLTSELAAAKKSKEDADKTRLTAERQLAQLKARVGYADMPDFGNEGDAANVTTVMGNVASDLERVGSTLTPPVPPAQTYKDKLAKLLARVESVETERDTKTKAYDLLHREFESTRKAEDAKVTQYLSDADAYKAQKEEVDAESKRKQEANDERFRDTKARADDIARQKLQLESDFTKFRDDKTRTVDLLSKEVNQFKDQMQKIQSAGTPVGSVVSVDNVSRQVYIDKGEADFLTLQTTFSVWASDKIGTMYWQDKNKKVKNDAAKEFEDSNRKNYLSPRQEAGPKAYIEIVQILGPNQAVGRITMDQIGNPIVPGDQLFSPVWKPGVKRRFALAGRFDMSGSGAYVNDRALLKELIKRMGGVIDAEVNDDGTIGGELQDIAVETYMLVKGNMPDALDPADPLKDVADNIKRASADLESKAKLLAVDVVDQQKFFDFMGYKVHSRKYDLGRYTGAPDALNRFENPSDSTRSRGITQDSGSSQPSTIPGLSGKKK